ncbi:MAG: elongation factor P [Bdellovibrionota bacterium]|nr:elongation factor P [Bdellovibrionota bacterium]
MYSTSDFRKGLKLLIDNEPYVITDFQHVKPGKGNQFTRTKMRNLISGSNLERTYKSGEKFGIPDVEEKEMSFLYREADSFNFMDQSSYETIPVMEQEVGDAALYITENMIVNVLFFNGRVIGVDVPNQVQLKVTQTEPGVKGDRVSGATKPATLETGLSVSVPLHINEGDVLKVDTRTNDYLERVSQG